MKTIKNYIKCIVVLLLSSVLNNAHGQTVSRKYFVSVAGNLFSGTYGKSTLYTSGFPTSSSNSISIVGPTIGFGLQTNNKVIAFEVPVMWGSVMSGDIKTHLFGSGLGVRWYTLYPLGSGFSFAPTFKVGLTSSKTSSENIVTNEKASTTYLNGALDFSPISFIFSFSNRFNLFLQAGNAGIFYADIKNRNTNSVVTTKSNSLGARAGLTNLTFGIQSFF